MLSRLDSGEEDKVPRWFATQPTAHQPQSFWQDIWAKCGEILIGFIPNSKCSFWFIDYHVCMTSSIRYQEANSEPLYANIPASGPNNSSESPVTTNTLLKSQANGWFLNFQKSGPNSPPLPETMPPPSWGAQGTRDVSSAPGNLLVFLLSSKMKWKGVEGLQLPANPWLARNNHRSGKLGSHLCKRWTGAPSSPDIDIFALERCKVQIKVLDCASLLMLMVQIKILMERCFNGTVFAGGSRCMG